MKYGKVVLAAILFAMLFYIGYTATDNARTVGKVATDVEAVMNTTELKEKGVNELGQYFDLSADAVDGFAIYESPKAGDVSETLIIKAKDPGQLEDLRAAVRGRIDRQMADTDYNEDQKTLLGNAVIRVRGKFLFFSVGGNAQSLAEAFDSSVRK